ncbi:hypothetical protein [Microbacterium sp. NIBRBAC000506063]|uniref:hypothetical protein n=1 Tax=Microbacterium sp. NIBRBAC000506063 TaxID=2734618 RepID=UPI001BB5A748|nr:hypothetical protein [Microbacterium sp. NIBRBAC000506063]QTV79525.1 hypothetical protein KAE78_11600 [Microbacterium sp. NIBRBAC000506063]
MTARQLRLLRATSASWLATLLAAMSHTLGGGAPPHPLLVITLAVFLTPVAALLVGPTPHRVRVALSVLVSQGVFHALFHALGTTAGGATAGHAHHVDPVALGPVTQGAATGPAMLAAHAAAALLTTLLLWHGEQLLLAVVRWVRAALRPLPAVPAPAHLTPAGFIDRMPVLRAAALGPVSRRGPPAIPGGPRAVTLAV